MHELTEEIIKYIKRNNLSEIKSLISKNERLPASEINFLLGLSNFDEINDLLQNWPQKEDTDCIIKSQIDDNLSNKSKERGKDKKESSNPAKNEKNKSSSKKNSFTGTGDSENDDSSIAIKKAAFRHTNKMCAKVHDPAAIIQKYKINQAYPDKVLTIFYDVFKNHIKECDFEQAAIVAKKIVDELVRTDKIKDRELVASKKLNLSNKANPELCQNVYNGTISPERYIAMTIEEMKSEDLKKREEKMKQDQLMDSQLPKLQADTTMFKCSRCKQSKTTYYQLQTRSADEPMTNYITCCVCGHKWKF
ncbi:transcription elongation factor S-II [Edhazardia aedis USNM 41457]|uniref:Transcription elongation factor S-II n=1 Tax=Edhazardia aedis (strain USNM 41457) TaxID=1003232 RepID=J8ZWR5_EDHAE|nr:transcription elongation factor S-II [Edhazardia aedis USNM 41457]|eukprot:EJW04098.1 transcription elongation factor S-II [Edhazardia aedis USNM 41457]